LGEESQTILSRMQQSASFAFRAPQRGEDGSSINIWRFFRGAFFATSRRSLSGRHPDAVYRDNNQHSTLLLMKNDLKDITKNFAHDCVKLALKLPNTYLGNHIKGQLIRCSTSVAANYRAVCLAQSRASFISIISIYTRKLVLEFNNKSSLFKRGFR